MNERCIRKAELDYCMKESLDFVDQQALEEAKSCKAVGDGTEDEEEKPDEWLVDVRYAARLLKKANDMRASKRLCDVTIGLADGKLEAHKNMLAAGSPFFKHLTETTQANTLNFFHVPCKVADTLFDFMYTGEVSQEKVAGLSRSEKRLLREQAELFQIADKMKPLWAQLGMEATSHDKRKAAPQESRAKPKKETPKCGADSNEIVKRKVLYMNERRKLEGGEFSDWKIRISAVDLPVSKVFLAASCTYFDELFARNPMEAKSETYTLTELNRRTFRKVLNFIYTGHVVTEGLELGLLKDLLFQATYLGIGDLSARLVEEIESRLSAENCFQMFSYAKTIKCRPLIKSISRYIGDLGSESAKNPGFQGLEFPDLRAVLLNPELRFDSAGPCLLHPAEFERRVFDLLVAWIRVDHVRRSSHVTELFDLVDLLGRPPFTGRKFVMHYRMPKELNHVMSKYYTKLLQEPEQPLVISCRPLSTLAIFARRHLLPTRLLLSREYPLAAPNADDAALMPAKLEPEGQEADGTAVSHCWQLAPTDWKLQSVTIFSADEAFTRLAGLEMRYVRYQLFLETIAEARTVCCGYRGAFETTLELLANERIAQLGLAKETSTCGGPRARVLVAWARTCIGRRLEVATRADRPVEGEEGETEEEEEEEQGRPAEVVRSPDGSRGFLHGLDLRFAGPGVGDGGGSLTVVWAVEADVHGLGDGPWRSVIEGK